MYVRCFDIVLNVSGRCVFVLKVCGKCLKSVFQVSGRGQEGAERYLEGVWSSQERSSWDRSGQVRTGQVGTGPVRAGQVGTGKSGQVKRTQV